MADLGVDAATDAVEKLRTKVRKSSLQSQEAVREGLREILMAEMEVGNTAMKLDTSPASASSSASTVWARPPPSARLPPD